MLSEESLRVAFPDLSGLSQLAPPSGQKIVLAAQRHGQDVVLKIIHPAQDLDRIAREIRAVAELACDYVPKILEADFRSIGGERRFFIVEKRVEGKTLGALLNDDPKPPLSFVLNLADQLLRACHDFEAKGLVHRDIKPANLIVAPDGKVWVLDFGIVRFLELESLTPTELACGPSTIGYGAPEQLRNQKFAINSRSDLYSIGIVLFECLNGSNPYLQGAQDQLQVVRRQLAQDTPTLRVDGDSADCGLAQFVTALCARFPGRRPQNAQQALDWFRDVRSRIETAAG